MYVALIIIVSLFIFFLYRRYIPVFGIQKINLHPLSNSVSYTIVDTRDYQISSQDKIDDACCLPIPYLHRHYNDLPNCNLIIVAKDHVDKNLSSRILRKKGKHIIGYHLKK
ncbi:MULTISPECIES: hypothetical protein [Virgibacillus]|uniref:Sulfurtransferase n=2 Tax=Virgibacillus TaxID=84406 RepID=A0A024QDZ1_9BACI|nr:MULTISPECIES: hypothetical protein [Virgibacillus]EQB36734.1 hypothetical protein M948_17015 [Virgibacillus sp. CM-4]MYL42561.1 hypothetical protein [Virgibacillus massiliensis]GGJ74158.1 hypothetical protein GCM10007111_39660 [Virgibacillus kapii]CDQ40442.1 hypothetical protein BN990_02766 [Virgibacillus massiliensis]